MTVSPSTSQVSLKSAPRSDVASPEHTEVTVVQGAGGGESASASAALNTQPQGSPASNPHMVVLEASLKYYEDRFVGLFKMPAIDAATFGKIGKAAHQRLEQAAGWTKDYHKKAIVDAETKVHALRSHTSPVAQLKTSANAIDSHARRVSGRVAAHVVESARYLRDDVAGKGVLQALDDGIKALGTPVARTASAARREAFKSTTKMSNGSVWATQKLAPGYTALTNASQHANRHAVVGVRRATEQARITCAALADMQKHAARICAAGYAHVAPHLPQDDEATLAYAARTVSTVRELSETWATHSAAAIKAQGNKSGRTMPGAYPEGNIDDVAGVETEPSRKTTRDSLGGVGALIGAALGGIRDAVVATVTAIINAIEFGFATVGSALRMMGRAAHMFARPFVASCTSTFTTAGAKPPVGDKHAPIRLPAPEPKPAPVEPNKAS